MKAKKTPLALVKEDKNLVFLQNKIAKLEEENRVLKASGIAKKEFLKTLGKMEKKWGRSLDEIYLEHAATDKSICKHAMELKLKEDPHEDGKKNQILIQINTVAGVEEVATQVTDSRLDEPTCLQR